MSAKDVWEHPIDPSKAFEAQWQAQTHLRFQSVQALHQRHMLRKILGESREDRVEGDAPTLLMLQDVLTMMELVLAESKEDQVVKSAPQREEFRAIGARILAAIQELDTEIGQ